MKFTEYSEFTKLYKFSKPISHNGNCEMYKSQDGKYAIKMDNFEKVIADIDWLSQLSHPNIIKVTHISYDKDNLYIAMKWCNKISDLNPDSYINTLLSTFASINSANILHGDIKPENIVYTYDFDHKPIIKIIDFGLTKHCTDGLFKGIAHTPKYADPEYNPSKGSYNKISGDTYSLGLTIKELYNRNINNSELEKLLLPSYCRPTILDVCKSMKIEVTPITRIIPSVPIKEDNSLITKYNCIIKTILTISHIKNTSIRTLILALHNIHRSINMVKNLSNKLLVIFAVTHLSMASASLEFTQVICSTWYPKEYSRIGSHHIREMAISIINELDGIITTPTLLDSNSLEYSLYNTLSYEYPNITYHDQCTNSKFLNIKDIETNPLNLLNSPKINVSLIPVTVTPVSLPTITKDNLYDEYPYVYASRHLLTQYPIYANKLLYQILVGEEDTKDRYYSIFGDKVYIDKNKYRIRDLVGNSYILSYDDLAIIIEEK